MARSPKPRRAARHESVSANGALQVGQKSVGNNGGVDGEYWLKRQERIGHWARVRVHVDPAEECEVRVLADACAWLAGVYGSCAATVVPVDLKEAAESGARLALTEAGFAGGVAVTRIEFAPADTSAEDVRFATAWAVWRAIGHEPAHAPYIDHEGVHFPAADG